MSDSSSSNVIAFTPKPITPKTLKRSYRSHEYVVTYIPKTKKWKWSVTITTKMMFAEEADTQVKAYRAAERFIDKNVKEQ